MENVCCRLPADELHGRQLSAEREVSDVLGGITALHLDAADKLQSNAVPRQLRGQVCLCT